MIPKKNKSPDSVAFQLKICKITLVAKIMTGFPSVTIISTSGSPSLPEEHDYMSFLYLRMFLYFMTFLSGSAMLIVITIPLIIALVLLSMLTPQ